MQLNPAVFDLWVFRRTHSGAEFLVLHASQIKADRHFNGGLFWQIPSGVFGPEESVLAAVDRVLTPYSLRAQSIWAAEHTYTIYNRRFDEIQIVSVFTAEIAFESDTVTLNPEEHAAYDWLPYAAALERVRYRGLRDGLRSTQEYVVGVADPPLELRLR